MAKSVLITITAGSSICSELQIYQKIGANYYLLESDVPKASLEVGYLVTGAENEALSFKVVDECGDSPCRWTEVILDCTTTTTTVP